MTEAELREITQMRRTLCSSFTIMSWQFASRRRRHNNCTNTSRMWAVTRAVDRCAANGLAEACRQAVTLHH
ncbi:unnamed protein product [Pleuronectes platessa]|uniref:Uncharacterized protein n=1 Tax=Pleuronectes platessa TaxID=8262 RepID=A0A9N7Y5X4_PLEPL|nr:unnamed protein product [Pleuronectes platessa]